MKYILLNFADRPAEEPRRYRLEAETADYVRVTPKYGRHFADTTETFTNRHGTSFVRIKPDRRKKPYTVRYDGMDGSVVRKFATLTETQEYVRVRWEGADYIDGPCAWHNDYGQFTAIGFRLADLGERGKPGTDACWTWEWFDILGTRPTPQEAAQAHGEGSQAIPTIAEIRAKLSAAGLTVSTETFWRFQPIESRRALLGAADLWDGNTYAALRWEELPDHIRGHLINANVDRQEAALASAPTDKPEPHCECCGKTMAECNDEMRDIWDHNHAQPDEADVCIAGNPARAGVCGNPDCVCSPGPNPQEVTK